MARGWESKSVESQIEAAEERSKAKQPQLTPEQVALKARRESLLLDQTRIRQQMLAARHPRHREMLGQALQHIDEKLAELGIDPVS